MLNFIPEKLFLQLQIEEQLNKKIIPRRYTLTHSDDTGEIFLSVGRDYDCSKTNKNDDEVLAEWIMDDDKYILSVAVELDGGSGLTKTVDRDRIFRDELPMALKCIVYGDRIFINTQESLKNAPIIVSFKSKSPKYNKIEKWGKVSDYTYKNLQKCHGRQVDTQFIPPVIYPPYPWPSPGPGPGPAPGPGPYPPSGPTKGKNAIVEKSLINALSSYIKSEIYVAFGRNAYYCLAEAEVIRARTIRTYAPCSEEYEVMVGLRVGRRPPRDNNIRITFIINENTIRVKDVDRPRPRPRLRMED